MPTPELALLPSKRPTIVAVGTTIRKPAAVLKLWLDSLAWQELPPNVKLLPIFVLDGCSVQAEQLVRDWAQVHNGIVFPPVGFPQATTPDFSDTHADTHQWSESAMVRVGQNKDFIIAEASRHEAAFLWFCDSDLICDTTTLSSLMAAPGPITTAVYWTHWSAQAIETRPSHAAPQVWLKHPYGLAGAGYAEHEFRARLAARQLTKVLGYGACTLLSRRALDAGVSFAPVPGVPRGGLMAGEDRQFCIRAQMLHMDGWADPWPDVYHMYHLPKDLADAPAQVARLSQPHAEHAAFGDLVNLTIQPIEPLPWAGGGFTAVPPQYVRGRLGALALMPEIEEVIYALKRGEARIVPVHFPVHYEVPFYQGKRRLIRVTLNDCKPLSWSPVLEREVLRGVRSGAAARRVNFTERQLEGMREVTHANG